MINGGFGLAICKVEGMCQRRFPGSMNMKNEVTRMGKKEEMAGRAVSANPYEGLSTSAFWRGGVAETSPFALEGVYSKKWPIRPKDKIATAGSCFAQHVARHLRSNGFAVMDTEPAPQGLPESQHLSYGYGMYSARFGNIYTTRQLLNLAREATGDLVPKDGIWRNGKGYFDAFRPAVEPGGLSSAEEVRQHRTWHLARVREMLTEMNVFIFTLGLTEAWENILTKDVFPTAPGTVAGSFDPNTYRFVNFRYPQVISDFNAFRAIVDDLRKGRDPVRYLLTVSPVPLTATASGRHVLPATIYSKSTLRAVAGDLAARDGLIDYFPSYEIITNPAARGTFYASNLRSVMSEGVEIVMKSFFAEHKVAAGSIAAKVSTPAPRAPIAPQLSADDVQCEEALLEAFEDPSR